MYAAEVQKLAAGKAQAPRVARKLPPSVSVYISCPLIPPVVDVPTPPSREARDKIRFRKCEIHTEARGGRVQRPHLVDVADAKSGSHANPGRTGKIRVLRG